MWGVSEVHFVTASLSPQVHHPGLSVSTEEEGRQEQVRGGGGGSGKHNVSRVHPKREEWSARQASLEQQVADAQAECR